MLNYSNEKIEKIKNGNGAELKSSAAFAEMRFFNNLKDFQDFCVQVNLNDFLELPKSFPCLFHEDAHASAGIFAKNGKYFYKCFSPNCECSEKALTLIHIVKRIRGKSYADAYQFLCNVLNCSIPSKNNNEKIKDIVQKNNEALERLKTIAPTAEKLLKKDIEVLEGLYDLILKNGGKVTKDGIVYSVSQRFLADYLEKNNGKSKLISRSLTFLAYLGFIEKIALYKTKLIDLDGLIELSKHSLAEGHSSRLTMQLLVKKLDGKTVERIEKNAIKWKILGYTKESLSFSTIAEKDGIWKANELYPQV